MRKLICFPFAGAGASFFRPWAQPLREDFSLVPIQLPGREKLFAQPPYRSVEEAINGLLPQLLSEINSASEVVIFGHSLGAALAYELARQVPNTVPCCLVVSGSPAPMRPRVERAAMLNDDEFLAQVRSFAGYSHPALDDPEMRELLLPLLRADVEMHEGYARAGELSIGMPIICLRGLDDELVDKADALAWQELTSYQFEYIEVEGGHMYLTETTDALFDAFAYARSLAAQHGLAA